MTSPDPARGIAKVILHPVRLRVLQAVTAAERTTAQLREALPDVPPATLYRHIGALLEADILSVVAERQVRGAVERTYGLGPSQTHVGPDRADDVDVATVRSAFGAYVAALAGSVEQHLDQPDWSALFGFSSTVVHIAPDEMAELQSDLTDLLARYREPREDRRPVTLSTVVVPSPPG